MAFSGTQEQDVSQERLKSLVAPLLRIPDEFRRFDTTREAAARDHGIDAATLDALADHGLPGVGCGAQALFDSLDVSSISLYLRARSARRDVMRFWLRSLRRIAAGPTGYRVEIRAECPMPRHFGACSYTVPQALGAERETVTRERRGALLGELVCRADQRPEPLPAPAAELASQYSDIDFYYLPTFLALNADFVERERVGDCTATAHAILDAATERGLQARLSFGFILSVPFSSPHTWTEISFHGRWFPIDPLLPKALRAWGIARDAQWPTDLSPLGLYHRISSEPIRLAWHGNAPCHAWLPARVAQ